jgi:translation initiation factor IF-3
LKENLPLINERIRHDKLQVITNEGQNLGVVSKRDALIMAQGSGLDLVLVTDKGAEGFPVAKIMDFGKVLYAKKKKAVDAKKKQKVIKVKEVKIRPKISDHDLQTKLRQAMQFFKEGKRVKITLVFKGREVATRNEFGSALFVKIDSTFANQGFNDLIMEKDLKLGQFWSRIYYLKD